MREIAESEIPNVCSKQNFGCRGVNNKITDHYKATSLHILGVDARISVFLSIHTLQ